MRGRELPLEYIDTHLWYSFTAAFLSPGCILEIPEGRGELQMLKPQTLLILLEPARLVFLKSPAGDLNVQPELQTTVQRIEQFSG